MSDGLNSRSLGEIVSPVQTHALASPTSMAPRPRFVKELVVLSLKHEVIVYGAPELHIFRGDATRGLLDSIINLSDGTRTIEQLTAALPTVPVENIMSVLKSLVAAGLIEDASLAPTVEALAKRETLAFFRRHIGTARSDRNGDEMYERLRASEVVVVNLGKRSSAGVNLQYALEESGIGHVTTVTIESLKNWHSLNATQSRNLLVIGTFLGGEDFEAGSELDDWCSQRHLSWLRVMANQDGSSAELGPIFTRKCDPCYRCFQEVHCQSAIDRRSNQESATPHTHFWAGMAATEAIYFLSRMSTLVTGKCFHRYDLKTWKSQTFRATRLPNCPRCSVTSSASRKFSSASASENCADTALVFEDVIGLSSSDMPGQGNEADLNAPRLIIGPQPKRLSNCTQFTLNQLIPQLKTSVFDAMQPRDLESISPISIDDLSGILMMTAGVRERWNQNRNPKRWAPTAGNLGSVELFVLAVSVDRLVPGIYFYQASDHSLALFQRRTDTGEIEELVRRVAPNGMRAVPDALVVFTGAFHRVARKYGPFGYRLINMDAGAALSQFHMAARSLNIASETVTRWADDLLEDHLNLEPFHEQVTAVAGLSRYSMKRQRNDYPGDPRCRPERPVSSRSLTTDFSGVPLEEMVRILHADSRIKESELDLGSSCVPPVCLNNFANRLEITTLPSPQSRGRTFGNVLATRKSIRQYTTEPVSQKQLATMLYWAHLGDLKDWPEEHQQGLQLMFLVMGWHVNGLNPGEYEYDPKNHVLIPLASRLPVRDRIQLFVQPEFASAPLCIWVAGNLAAACSRHGAFGHRQLLLRAGAAGHRLLMSGAALDLSGCLVAGMVTGPARCSFGFDGQRRASLLGVTTGYAAPTLLDPPVSGQQRGILASSDTRRFSW